jgi:predicted ATPase
MSEEHPAAFEELNSLLGPNGLNVIQQINIFAHSFKAPTQEAKSSSFFFVNFYLSGYSDQSFSIQELSFGTIRILFLLVAMLYDRANVALLEQPEDGMHVGLIKKLIPLLRSYSIQSQFIISSHSAAVLNRSLASEIRFITNDEGFTQARALSEDELDAAQQFLEEDGTLAEFLESIGD